MKFLQGLGAFVVGIILIFIYFNQKRISLGPRLEFLLFALPILGLFYMITSLF